MTRIHRSVLLGAQTFLVTFTALFVTSTVRAKELPEWTAKIRSDHPRLFFNAETWPAVRARALNQERDWYESVKKRVDRLAKELETLQLHNIRHMHLKSHWIRSSNRVLCVC